MKNLHSDNLNVSILLDYFVKKEAYETYQKQLEEENLFNLKTLPLITNNRLRIVKNFDMLSEISFTTQTRTNFLFIEQDGHKPHTHPTYSCKTTSFAPYSNLNG
jgi:hypothetical protein